MKMFQLKNVIKLTFLMTLFLTSCASKKEMIVLHTELETKSVILTETKAKLDDCNQKKMTAEDNYQNEQIKLKALEASKNEMIGDLRLQIDDLKKQREQQFDQVGDLTVLSKKASDNIGETIRQLEKKDKYINRLQEAKTKADSLNLALSFNLKSVLRKGIEDEDIEVKVDKTVVFINLSDKMLFESGSYQLTPRANEVLEKIATIANSKPDLELLVEGYTDNVRIANSCMEDNWDLSVKRSTSVVRKLQKDFGVNPNKLIAAGRGEYNALADNSTDVGRSINRRTRIILMPKLNQFYDLLKPMDVSGK